MFIPERKSIHKVVKEYKVVHLTLWRMQGESKYVEHLTPHTSQNESTTEKLVSSRKHKRVA